jgi:hypothetical protein
MTALYDQFFGDSGRLHRSFRCHFAFMSASARYRRFFKASSTPSMSRSWILRLSSNATCRSASVTKAPQPLHKWWDLSCLMKHH